MAVAVGVGQFHLAALAVLVEAALAVRVVLLQRLVALIPVVVVVVAVVLHKVQQVVPV
jgi:hypothetical protein